jgi:hypothetical protein
MEHDLLRPFEFTERDHLCYSALSNGCVVTFELLVKMYEKNCRKGYSMNCAFAAKTVES